MRIIIFEPHPDISTNPVLINIIRRFSEDGISIEIYQPEHGRYLPLEVTKKNVILHTYSYSLYNSALRFMDNLYALRYLNILQRQKVYDRLSQGLLQEKGIVILAIDQKGVIEAYKYSNKLNVPYIYLSFEIFFSDELAILPKLTNYIVSSGLFKWLNSFIHIKGNNINSKSGKNGVTLNLQFLIMSLMNILIFSRAKKNEIEANQKAAFTIIQDKQREELLRSENRLSRHDMFYLPVAPSAYPMVKKNDYIREKYNISKNELIVIHAGSFGTWTYAEELIESTRHWPENIVLFIHTRHCPDNKNTQMISKNKFKNIIFSSKPYDSLEYEEMLASADVGLVLYKPNYANPYLGKNLERIGLASGKLSYYMKYGIPTISFSQQSYKDLLKDYKYGIDLNNFEEFPSALMEIRRSYSVYSGEAYRLFREKLNFDLYYPALKQKLLELSESGQPIKVI